MSIGDLVFCHGFRGLILEKHHGTYYTEYRVYWLCTYDPVTSCSWVQERQLFRIA